MTVNFDPTSDFADVVDGTQTVTLSRRGSSSQTVVTHALRRAVDLQEARVRNLYNTWKAVPSEGRHTAADVTWHLPKEQLGESPRLGDLIVDGSGRRWTVLDVQTATLKTRWQCFARELAVVYGLDDTVAILAAVYAKGDGGAAEPTWQTWKTGVRARIQPAEVDVDVEHQARRTSRRFQIFVEEDVALDHNHRIQGPDGTVYSVRGTSGTERIDQVQTIDAEVSPWPAA